MVREAVRDGEERSWARAAKILVVIARRMVAKRDTGSEADVSEAR